VREVPEGMSYKKLMSAEDRNLVSEGQQSMRKWVESDGPQKMVELSKEIPKEGRVMSMEISNSFPELRSLSSDKYVNLPNIQDLSPDYAFGRVSPDRTIDTQHVRVESPDI